MYIDHHGKMTVINYKNKEYCEVDFKKRGWSNKNAFEVEGYAYNSMKERIFKIWGKWIENLYIKNMITGEEE